MYCLCDVHVHVSICVVTYVFRYASSCECLLNFFSFLFSKAAKLIANLIIMGSGILGRAVLQAYRKALESKSFVPSAIEKLIYGLLRLYD